SQPEKGPEWNGLSPLGREAVRECNRLGLVIDGSHAADATVRQLIAESQTPIILTHSACKAIRDHPRNVDDGLMRELATRGGVIQVTAVPLFLRTLPPDPETEKASARAMARAAGRHLSDAAAVELRLERYRLRARKPPPPVGLDDFLEHLFHAIKVVGTDHVGIGSDMDGGGGVIGFEDVAQCSKITLALLKRGMAEADVEKIWGGNARRLLRIAEEHAQKARAAQ
ncbi:MAG: membrane dipeptidase, partial [Verrucomicrobia bacterium]|nr:membrane dipeptidase [Verrucomicrobiota bacterium]